MSIESPQPKDVDAIIRVAETTGVFTPIELSVVRELVDAFFDPNPRDDHTFIVYRNGNPDLVAGFACFGPTPLTDRVWDLYWICVERSQQSNGIGSQLLHRVEEYVRAQGARAIYLETSDSAAYRPAREFYERHGYQRVAYLPNFYTEGEGKIIYYKSFEK